MAQYEDAMHTPVTTVMFSRAGFCVVLNKAGRQMAQQTVTINAQEPFTTALGLGVKDPSSPMATVSEGWSTAACQPFLINQCQYLQPGLGLTAQSRHELY